MTKKTNSPAVLVVHPCYICGNYSNIIAYQTIAHVQNVHRKKLISRRVGHARPHSSEFKFIVHKDAKKYRGQPIRWGCTSCWFHCSKGDLKAIVDHVEEVHQSAKFGADILGKRGDIQTAEYAEEEEEVDEWSISKTNEVNKEAKRSYDISNTATAVIEEDDCHENNAVFEDADDKKEALKQKMISLYAAFNGYMDSH